ncbi:MAG TPA: zf-HC2 domain-containing protein [Candidatus Binatia bacterium]|jgi:anti-sigma factor RsiW
MSECDRIQEWLGAWLDGELPPARSDEVKLHVEKCAACAAEKVRIQRLDAALKRALEARVSDAAFAPFWAGVRERIAREKSWNQRVFNWMRGVFAFPRLAWAIPVTAVVLIALFSTIRYSDYFSATNQASVESIDGHGFNVALLREAKTKTTVIWLFENQETEDDNSVEPAASEQAF